MSETIRRELLLPQPREQVWRALTDSATLAEWMYPNDFEPRVGHHFTFRVPANPKVGFDGLVVCCEVLECEPPSRLTYSWAGGELVDTRVSYRLESDGDGTRLVFEHSGFDLAQLWCDQAIRELEFGYAKMFEQFPAVVARLAPTATRSAAEQSVALDQAGVAVVRNTTFLAAGPASKRSCSAAQAEGVCVATAPGITQWIPLPYGFFKEFLRDPLGYQLRARARFGDVFRSRIGPSLVHFLYHPDHVRRVLYDHQKNYPRGWHYRLLRSLLGNGLVASEGDHWRRQRRLAQPAFHRQRLSGYAQVMVEATSGMLARWEGAAAAGTSMDIGVQMSRLSLAIAGLTLFSRDPSQEADVVGGTFDVLARYLEQRFNHPFTSLPAWVPTAGNRRMKDAARTLNSVVLALIQERRREGRDHGDLLSMLIQARDEETGEAMTEDHLCSEALTFLVAGQETTSTALTWTWFLLGSHPSIRQRAREEVGRVLGDRLPTFEDVPHLIATRMAIEESMRLYPPVWALAREAAQEDEIGGYRIPPRSTVILSPFVTHRHPAVWEQPEVFDPDRFTPEHVAQRPRGAYFPFLGGPHQCIGNEFAMLEMCLIVAMVLQRFDVELLADQAIVPKAALTLRPSAPVRVMLKRGSPKPAPHLTGAACKLSKTSISPSSPGK